MPLEPSVFHPIKSNDVQERQIYAHKNFSIGNTDSDQQSFNTGSGFMRMQATHGNFKLALGDYGYASSMRQATVEEIDPKHFTAPINKHVVWRSIEHKYYRYPFDPARCHELTNPMTVEKKLHVSASILTIPYFDVGERAKAGSVVGFFQTGSTTFQLEDDYHGNWRDPLIITASFASASREILHMSFNNDFRQFKYRHGVIDEGQVTFNQGKAQRRATAYGIQIEDGIDCIGQSNVPLGGMQPSGLAAKTDTNGGSYIRLEHDKIFDSFGNCDDWTISFWFKKIDQTSDHPILSKGGLTREQYYDSVTSWKYRNSGKTDVVHDPNSKYPRKTKPSRERYKHTVRSLKWRDKLVYMPSITSSYKHMKTPFLIGVQGVVNNSKYSSSYHFQCSDGSNSLHISSSVIPNTSEHWGSRWDHVVIRNSSSLCQIIVNGDGGSSGAVPSMPTANAADVIIGAFPSSSVRISKTSRYGVTNANEQHGLRGESLAEFRMYNYAVSDLGISSLGNNDWVSGSIYQTNVAGNIFYKNGQMVISSPLPKYNTGSGAFHQEWDVHWKGTHKIYENNVLVRVPRDFCNISMNPSATFKPPTEGEHCSNPNQENVLPGEFRKNLFVSGTLTPYVTTIGLYDDKCRLLAIGKLAQPVKKLDDLDTNFVVRWDY